MPVLKDRLDNLNREQRKAVDTIEGPVMVVAGPGSGKTEILSLRVANILEKTDIYPGNILCLTFTDSAAANMRERLVGLIGPRAYKVAIYTFHGFSVDIINRYPEYFYDGALFSPADEIVQTEVLEKIFKDLSHDNPLRKEHPEQGFIYLKHAGDAISNLKRAGISPSEFKEFVLANNDDIQYINKAIGVFDERVSIKNLDPILKFADHLDKKVSESPLGGYESLAKYLSKSLKNAVSQAEDEGKTAPLSDWKAKYTCKEDEVRVLKDSTYSEKLFALADIYADYLKEMHSRGYYDFDDMLLNILNVLKDNKTLRYELQERFQYVLVDEFQDTNNAQMRLLEYLTDAEVHEGRPNIMAVGDDDQAIYKFQGAEVSNILEFQKKFRDPEFITLTHNYRSRQEILDLARHVIVQGKDRLENRVEGIKKDLVAANKEIREGNIYSRAFPTQIQECKWISEEIKRLINEGKDPGSIAIIARQHKDLQAIQPYLSALKIPVAYERQRNVLREPHISQLIILSKFIDSIGRNDRYEADEYLPQILSFPFWGLPRKAVWELSVRAANKNSPWLDEMLNGDDAKLKEIAEFMIELGNKAKYEPADRMLDLMIGSHDLILPESEDEDENSVATTTDLISPFKDFYFKKELFDANKGSYLAFLSGLRVFIQALREHKHGESVMLSDLISFVDMHESNKIPINDQSPFISAHHSVHLLSSHKAKGLEFETVFVIGCQDDVWAGGSRGKMLPFPANLPIYPAGDNEDDQLRLFYVAITRAKCNLYMTSYERSEAGKDSSRLRFLVPSESATEPLKKYLEPSRDTDTDDGIISALSIPKLSKNDYLEDENELLRSILQNYQMSVTHLNNFLNVADGGPKKFFEQNLLRFPQAKTPSGCFGSAMHKAVELAYLELKKNGVLPLTDDVLNFFKKALKRERLSQSDYKLFEKRGEKALRSFYEEKSSTFAPTDLIEVNFKNQGVVIDGVPLSGKIDKISFPKKGEVVVYDFKTGDPLEDWKGNGSFEKIKLYKYRNQLLFYKLLVENSRDFSSNTVSTGVLEFLEPKKGNILALPMEIDSEEISRLTKLISVVYKHIIALDFPDTSKYSEDLKGILDFEDDLLNSAI